MMLNKIYVPESAVLKVIDSETIVAKLSYNADDFNKIYTATAVLDALASYGQLEELWQFPALSLSIGDINSISQLTRLHTLSLTPLDNTCKYPDLARILCKDYLPVLANLDCDDTILIPICHHNTCHLDADETCFKRLNNNPMDRVNGDTVDIWEGSILSKNLLEFLNITTPLQEILEAWEERPQLICQVKSAVNSYQISSIPLHIARLILTEAWDASEVTVESKRHGVAPVLTDDKLDDLCHMVESSRNLQKLWLAIERFQLSKICHLLAIRDIPRVIICTTQTESDQQLLTQRFPSTEFNFSYSYMGDDPYDQDYDPYDLDYDPYDQDYD